MTRTALSLYLFRRVLFWQAAPATMKEAGDPFPWIYGHSIWPYIPANSTYQYDRFLQETGGNWGSKPDDGPDHPVVSRTWHDAQAYCEWAG